MVLCETVLLAVLQIRSRVFRVVVGFLSWKVEVLCWTGGWPALSVVFFGIGLGVGVTCRSGRSGRMDGKKEGGGAFCVLVLLSLMDHWVGVEYVGV